VVFRSDEQNGIDCLDFVAKLGPGKWRIRLFILVIKRKSSDLY
jgi:hypothetical protein